jgi:hypothetical protein
MADYKTMDGLAADCAKQNPPPSFGKYVLGNAAEGAAVGFVAGTVISGGDPVAGAFMGGAMAGMAAAEAVKSFDHDTWHDAVKAEKGKAACIGAGVAKLDSLKVDDDLDLRDTGVSKLPNNLKVRHSLNLSRTGVTELSDGLEVGGGLDVSDTRISKLPDNFEVGMLDLSRSGVTKLPNNLKVHGNLYLYGTGVTKLPDDLKVGGKVYGFNGAAPGGEKPPLQQNVPRTPTP